MELTPELLLKLHPSIYWQIWKAGFAQAKSDPQTRKSIAEEYLKSTLTQEASPASPRSPAVAISPEQTNVNRQLGLSDETFQKFANGR